MSISPMDLATYYGVDDIPAALSIGDNLHSLLVAIFRNEPLTSPRYDILASYDLNALRGFINGDMTLPEFRRQSAVEQEQRRSKSLYYKGRKIVHRYQPSITKPLAAQPDDKANIEDQSKSHLGLPAEIPDQKWSGRWPEFCVPPRMNWPNNSGWMISPVRSRAVPGCTASLSLPDKARRYQQQTDNFS